MLLSFVNKKAFFTVSVSRAIAVLIKGVFSVDALQRTANVFMRAIQWVNFWKGTTRAFPVIPTTDHRALNMHGTGDKRLHREENIPIWQHSQGSLSYVLTQNIFSSTYFMTLVIADFIQTHMLYRHTCCTDTLLPHTDRSILSVVKMWWAHSTQHCHTQAKDIVPHCLIHTVCDSLMGH